MSPAIKVLGNERSEAEKRRVDGGGGVKKKKRGENAGVIMHEARALWVCLNMKTSLIVVVFSCSCLSVSCAAKMKRSITDYLKRNDEETMGDLCVYNSMKERHRVNRLQVQRQKYTMCSQMDS